MDSSLVSPRANAPRVQKAIGTIVLLPDGRMEAPKGCSSVLMVGVHLLDIFHLSDFYEVL